jgi:hypothetical protein
VPLPNFIVIGAAKCGTTSLHRYLNQHPQIFMSAYGEPSYFAHQDEVLNFQGPGDAEWKFVTDLTAYEALFDGARGEKAIGEISPRYLYFEKSAERMRALIPKVRIIAILRNPVDRAYSHFLMNTQRHCEPAATLMEAVELERDRVHKNWGWDWRYVSLGLYHQQLKRYYDLFPVDQIKVILYDDFRDNPVGMIQDLFHFLGVDESFVPDMSKRERPQYLAKSKGLDQWVSQPSSFKKIFHGWVGANTRKRIKDWILQRNSAAVPPLAVDIRQALDQKFRADRVQLQKLIGRDLSRWGQH